MDKSILKDISSSVLFGLEVLGVALTHGLTAEDGHNVVPAPQHKAWRLKVRDQAAGVWQG